MRDQFPTFSAGTSFLTSRIAASGLLALVLWVMLNTADAFLTWRSFNIGAEEFNPLLVQVQSTLGDEGMLLLKLLLASVVGAYVWSRGKRRILRAINWLMTGVVTYNVAIMGYLIVR